MTPDLLYPENTDKVELLLNNKQRDLLIIEGF